MSDYSLSEDQQHHGLCLFCSGILEQRAAFLPGGAVCNPAHKLHNESPYLYPGADKDPEDAQYSLHEGL